MPGNFQSSYRAALRTSLLDLLILVVEVEEGIGDRPTVWRKDSPQSPVLKAGNPRVAEKVTSDGQRMKMIVSAFLHRSPLSGSRLGDTPFILSLEGRDA